MIRVYGFSGVRWWEKLLLYCALPVIGLLCLVALVILTFQRRQDPPYPEQELYAQEPPSPVW